MTRLADADSYLSSGRGSKLKYIDNYIYLYHLDTFVVIPGYMDSIQDQMQVQFSSDTPLARSAPIYSYKQSGPRSLQVSVKMHRDMMEQLNTGISNAKLGLSNAITQQPNSASEYSNDYVDFAIHALQACAVPSYAASQKMVNPPLVAVRLGKEVFIKGVVTGTVGVTYTTPILSNGKYASVDVSFTVEEVDPYDAETILAQGSYRGLTTSLERRVQSFIGGEK